MLPRKEIKAQAKAAVGGQRRTAILIMLVFMLIVSVYGFISSMSGSEMGQGVLYWIGYFVGLFVLLVMEINLYGEYYKVFKRENASVGALFSGFKVNFLRKLGGSLWMLLWLFLWTLLLIVPGIIKYFAYFFTSNILAVHPNVPARQALKVSMRITKGHKMDIFIFVLSFIGWFLLSVLTLGILYIVYVGPYYYTAVAGLFIELRDKAIEEGRVTKEELGME